MDVEIITIDWNHVNKSNHTYFGNMICQMYPNPKLIPNSVLKYFEAYQRKIDSAFKEFANKIIKLDDKISSNTRLFISNRIMVYCYVVRI